MGALFLIFVVPVVMAFFPMVIISCLNVGKIPIIFAAIISLAIIAAMTRLSYIAFAIGEGDPDIPIYFGVGQFIVLLVWSFCLLIYRRKW